MIDYLKQKATNLPASPGIYFMKDKKDHIIYIGKANKLKERVKSYFMQNKQHSNKTKRMVQQIHDFSIITTDTELDALLLECQEIQKHRPIYNRQMNHFERYHYLEVNIKQEKPQIFIRSTPTEQACFGPFPTRYQLKKVKWIIQSVYGLNQKNTWQQSIIPYKVPALSNKQITTELLDTFNGCSSIIQERIEQNMQETAENYLYEKAILLRDDWQFITRFFSKLQKTTTALKTSWQICWCFFKDKVICYLLFQGLVVSRKIYSKRTFRNYSLDELAVKIAPKEKPVQINFFAKDQIDFMHIFNNFIARQPEYHLVSVASPF
ncbi:GIY-YIG nuclease family protein [Enterococcus sp. LJL99]